MNLFNKSLSAKITLIITVFMLLVFVVLTIFIAINTSNSLIVVEKEKLKFLSSENAKIAESIMEQMVGKQSVVISAIKNLDTIPEENRIDRMKELMSTVKAEEDQLLSIYYIAGDSNDFSLGLTIYADESGAKFDTRKDIMLSKPAYDKMESEKRFFILDPYKKVINGKEYLVISILRPVLDKQNNLLGLVGADIDTEVLYNADYNTGGYVNFSNIIVCAHQTIMVHTNDKSAIGAKFVDITRSKNPSLVLDAVKESNAITFVDEFKDGTKVYSACQPFFVADSDKAWLSTISIPERDIMTPIVRTVVLLIAFCTAALVILAAISFFVLKKSLKPIAEIEAVANDMANGNFNTEIKFTGINEIGRLADSMRYTVASLSESFSKINESAEQVSSGAEQMAGGVQNLAQGAITQASSVEELSSSIREMSSQITKNAENAIDANNFTKQAEDKLNSGTVEMQDMLSAMAEISEKSSQINKIIKTIEDIAFQTNILALNAAVEAARAGHAGRGFAVVADEVRNLASKSAEAAKTTSKLINDSVLAVKKGDEIANNTANTLNEVTKLAKKSSVLVTDIASDCEKQASSIIEISKGVDEISSVVQTNSATFEQSAAASQELSIQAQILKQSISKFKISSQRLKTNSDSDPDQGDKDSSWDESSLNDIDVLDEYDSKLDNYDSKY